MWINSHRAGFLGGIAMKVKWRFLWMITLACVVLIPASCRSPAPGWGGPPPHAPAHGYRHKYQGVDVIYDSGRGVYIVVGLPSHYYYEGHFYRFGSVQWEVSAQIGGPWRPVSRESLPPGLRAKEKAKGKPREPPGRAVGSQKKR